MSEPQFTFTTLQEALLDWPTVALPKRRAVGDDGILDRILQILSHARVTTQLDQAADLAALMRQALLSRSVGAPVPARLSVPTVNGWPNAAQWEHFGLEAVGLGDRLVIEARPWWPAWLESAMEDGEARADADIFAEIFAGRLARQPATVPIDPFLAETTGFADYVCPGQREAVRSLFFMPAGSTLIVNLPTGSGKTLVAQAAVLTSGLSSGLTLFVVPTRALASDHARRMRVMLTRQTKEAEIPPLAWHGDLNAEARQTIKSNIRHGRQGILFASPEAVTGALLPSLYEAAERGLLKYFVIDEAHMIVQWGDSFRPEFQALSGIRRGLLRRCPGEPFRTVLLSATFSPDTVETLDVLFGPRSEVQMVSAVHLRPEPRYWSHRAANWEIKRERVLELVRHAPRPFILYVTERKHARSWLTMLREAGYQRIDCFHGETPDGRREEIIDAWASNRLDGIVATSAFGVGVDKHDVRTVIHATVPETLDRFYQEVGRGGRDGRPSISVAVYTDRDEGVARGLNRPSFIGDDKAFDRWNTMFDTARQTDDPEVVTIDVKAVPPHLRQQSDYSTGWNMKTLILMARAGMIELDSTAPQPLARRDDEAETAFDARLQAHWEAYFGRFSLRTLDPAHRSPSHFEARLSRERERGHRAAERSFTDLMDALEGQREMAEVLSSLYRNHAPGRTVIVSPTCGGCPAERTGRVQAVQGYQIPAGIGIERIAPPDLSAWKQRFPWLAGGRAVVLYPRDGADLDRRVGLALRTLVAVFGVREVAAPAVLWKADVTLRALHHAAPSRVVVARALEEQATELPRILPLPRASLLRPWGARPIPHHLLMLDRPLHVVFAPEDISSDHPLRRYADTATDCISLDDFIRTATI